MAGPWIVRICIAGFFVSVSFGQLADPPSPTAAAPQEVGGRIRLDVVVNDKSGNAVPGLEEKDFTVVDNKQPQKLVSFQAVTKAIPNKEPVQVILVIDGVNTPYERTAYAKNEIKRFLQQNGGQLRFPTSLAYLSDKGLQLDPMTSRDGNALAAQLDQNETALRIFRRGQGFYAANDLAQLSLRALEGLANYAGKIEGKKIVIFLSPGWPLLSGPAVVLSSKEAGGIFQTIVALSTFLRQAGVTLYDVDPNGANQSTLSANDYERFLKGVRPGRQVYMGDLALQVIASQSGGRVMTSRNDLAAEIAACVHDADAYYILSFDAPRADGPNEYHELDVRIDRPKLKAQTRAGYYVQPEPR